MSVSAATPSVILTSRYGGDKSRPSADELAEALVEIYHEDHASMTEKDYAEHPNAWLRYGLDGGPMYVLDVYREGRVHFSQWADQDYEAELAPETALIGVNEEEALHLWKLLANGEIDQIKQRAWNAI